LLPNDADQEAEHCSQRRSVVTLLLLSDNGGATNLGASNAPLREEGGYRVPMFFHWAGKILGGEVFDHPVLTMDFYPALAKLVDASVPEGKALDGKDIWDDLIAGRNPHEGKLIPAISDGCDLSGVGARLGQWKVT